MMSGPVNLEMFSLVCLSLTLRATVSLHSYSGQGKPPIYGDYEAQRHWQEITVNLKPSHWYKNSTENNLLYWGLDYPPLTAYHSFLIGIIAKNKDCTFVELQNSRGFESSPHKSFMRLTVLVADIFIYLPGILTLALTVCNAFDMKTKIPLVVLVSIYPGQILIDNGHFQYNNVSLGLTAFAIALLLKNRWCLSAFFFSLALNYKQMELYHAMPFFVYLLRVCLTEKSVYRGARELFKISVAVISTFVALWLPWIHSFEALGSVVKRLFPFGRGVFEDKVANVWCVVNIFYKLKENVSNQEMAFICLCTTLVSLVPINVHLFLVNRKEKFLYSLFNTAMAFFLFSFQVHEKSILLAVLPALVLFGFIPHEMFWFLELSVFSMLPLLIKDSLSVAFFVLLIIFFVSMRIVCSFSLVKNNKSHVYKIISSASLAFTIVISLATLFAPSPVRYPFFWPLIISLYCCSHFLLFFIFGVCYQIFGNKILHTIYFKSSIQGNINIKKT